MKKLPKIIHLGGYETVTGSCHLLSANGLNILVDCGLVQGSDHVIPMEKWPIGPKEIDFLFLTHAHIDHIGRLPELLERGFRGEIITTHPTKALLEPMLRDTLGLQKVRGREGKKVGEGISDFGMRISGRGRSIEGVLEALDELCWGFEYGEAFDLRKGVTFKLGRAGHILGSCFVRFESQSPEWSVIFSGDLGAKNTPILPDPEPPDVCDLLILESTYGDRLHEDRTERVERLGKVLKRCLADGGKVFIPAFSLGRTQELLFELDRLCADPDLGIGSRVPVCIDSPLGLEITRIYSRLKPFWDEEARELLRQGDDPLDFAELYAVTRFKDHRELVHTDGPAVIVAGSGMCTGGRIIDHLLHGLDNPRNDVLFVGYQASGTPGRDIITYAGRPGGYVDLDGRRIKIRAGVHVLGGYSAHADRKGLVDWVHSMPRRPARIRLVHGEVGARERLGEFLILNF